MKAVVKTRPGVGIEIKEIPKPTFPKNFPKGEVLVKVEACGICGTDVAIYHWTPWVAHLMQIPKVIGHEISGTIVEVGQEAGNWKAGDKVVSIAFLGCGHCYFCQIGKFNLCDNLQILGTDIDGGMAEYVAIHKMNLFHLPLNISFEAGAAIEPLGISMHAFFQSDFKVGDKILILGPGPIGLGLLMIAKLSGASKIFVTGINLDCLRLQKAKEWGADMTFDIGEENPIDRVMQETNGKGVDIAFVCAGSEDILMQASIMVRKGGTVVVPGLFHGEVKFDANRMVDKELTFKGSWRRNPEPWYRTLDLVEHGLINLEKMISHRISLCEIEKGFQLIDRGEAIKVIVTI